MTKKHGEGHPNAKLKASDIPVIRARIREGHHGIIAHLARTYGVHWSTICQIRDGVIWRSVPE